MAERRMFAKTIIDSDAFLDMPLSAQSLYFHLNMRADDDGFVNNPKRIQKMIGASDDDYRLLTAKSFILTFESGVIVIKHWRLNNYIQKDRYKPTVYEDEKSRLIVKENNAYSYLDTDCIQNVYSLDTQVRLGKVSLEKENIESESKNNKNTNKEKNKLNIPPLLNDVIEYFLEIKSTSDEANRFYDYYTSNGWKVGNKGVMKDWKASARNWVRNNKNWEQKQSKSNVPDFKNPYQEPHKEPEKEIVIDPLIEELFGD